MASFAEVLRQLHRIHRQLGDLRERRERGPRQVRAREANVVTLDERLAKAHHDVKSARVLSDQKQLALKVGEEKIASLKIKLNQAASNREYQALKDQIAADEMANSVLADEIIELLDKIEELKKATVDVDQDRAKVVAERDKVAAAVQEAASLLEGDIQRLEAELATVENELPYAMRDDYARVMKGKGSDGMAAIENEDCGGCFQRLTPNMINDLLMSKLVFCKNCGRLLYQPEDRSIGQIG